MKYFLRLFSFIRYYARVVKAWLLTPVPRWRPILATTAFIAIAIVMLLYGGSRIFAATFNFTQTSWSGGANTGSYASHNNLSDRSTWNKYYSKSANVSAGATVALTASASSAIKAFSTTNTTSDRDTAKSITNAWTSTATIKVPTQTNPISATPSSVSNIFGTASIGAVYDPTSRYVIIGNRLLGSNKLAVFDTQNSMALVYDLSSTWSVTGGASLAVDTVNSVVYAVNNAKVLKIPLSTCTASSCATTDVTPSGWYATYWNSGVKNVFGVLYDTTNNVIWVGGGDGAPASVFLKLTPNGSSAMTVTDYTSKRPSGYGSVSGDMVLDTLNNKIYVPFGYSGGGFTVAVARFDPLNPSATMVPIDTSVMGFTFNGFWPYYDATHNVLYMTNGAQSAAIYNMGSSGNCASNCGTAVTFGSGYWPGGAPSTAGFLYDPTSDVIYNAGSSDCNAVPFGKMNAGATTLNTKTSLLPSVWRPGGCPGMAIYSMMLDPINDVVYLAGTNGNFTSYLEPSKGIGQSININTGGTTISSATLTAKTDSVGSGTITYQVASDCATSCTWQTATLNSAVTFGTPSTDIRFKITVTGNATVSSITLALSSLTPTLVSNWYDSGDNANLVSKLAWIESSSTSDLAKFQIRTAPDSSGVPGTPSAWCGYADSGSTCTGSNYFSGSGHNGVSVSSGNALMRDGNDRWYQYQMLLTTSQTVTVDTVSSVTVTYVVNAPPEFNPSNGLVVSQITDSNDANFGKVSIAYSIRDGDTSTGTTDPGFITPSFQYNIGGGLVTINSNKLSTNATAHQAVDGTNYTTLTAYWDAQSDIPANYLTTAVVKVTLNDQEAANNTASSTSSVFTLDTKVPVVSAFRIDSTTDTLTLTSTDDTVLQYRISNNADLSADGVNGTSGAWQSPAVNSISLTPSWTLTGTPSYETVYLQVRDVAGNVTAATAVAPSTPLDMNIQDVSNPNADLFKEFLSWSVYVPTSGATFLNYKVYSSTDGSNYNLVSTITDATTNYTVHQDLTDGTTYYYKIRTTDTDNDVSNYSAVVSDAADGQGGTDSTAPAITNVVVAEQQATYIKITWDTDELANAEVDYSVSPSTTFGTHEIVNSYSLNHSVTIVGLTPNTPYLFRVKSTDISNNSATEDNSGAGFTATTVGGPIISNVTETLVNEHSATIFWNTDKDSDSHVSYSTSSSLSSSTRVGSTSLVGGPPYQHTVNLTGLTSGNTYYYFVESTDASSNDSRDTNGNNYYSFVTTTDTKAPVITDVDVPVFGLNAAVVVWTTDELSSSIVDYGTTSGSYTSSTTLDPTLTIFHIGSLSGLTENTKYYYRVRSSDGGSNEAISTEYDFTTDQTHIVTVRRSAESGEGDVVVDTTKPVISNIKQKDIKSFSATVSFDTDEDTVGFIDYGLDASLLNQTSGDSAYSQSHEITLTGLLMGKKYTFVIKAVDKAGNVTNSETQTLTTTFFTESTLQIKDAAAFQKEVEEAIEAALPSLVAPFIEKPQVVDITDNSAKVTWKTNIKSYGSVAYADDSTYDETKDNPYENEAADTITKATEHSIDLPNLKPNTRYHIMVRSFSLPEVVGKSKDLTFITEALKIQANVGSITNNSFTANWTTSEPTTSVVEYRNTKTGVLNQKSSDVKTQSHDILIDGLTPGTIYTVNVFGYNEKGNKISIASSITIKTSIDTTAPKITGLTIDSALIPGRNDRTQTIVSWKTDEPSTSTVFFKEGSALPDEKLTNKVEMTNNFVIDHAVVVSSLKPGGLYSIQVASTDAAGNQVVFPIRTAVVPQQSQSVIEIIFKNFEDTFEFLK